jgi:hypothetical protein
MSPEQAKNFKGLVWCPESNWALLKKHAHISALKDHTRLVFGTDSTLTGSWNLWHHLRFARSLRQVSDSELFELVTRAPSKLWNLNTGELNADQDADIVIVKKKGGIPSWDEVYKTNPEDILLIIHNGKIRMFDKAMYPQLICLPFNLQRFSKIIIKGNVKYIEGNLPALIAGIKTYNPRVNFPVEGYEEYSTSVYDR